MIAVFRLPVNSSDPSTITNFEQNSQPDFANFLTPMKSGLVFVCTTRIIINIRVAGRPDPTPDAWLTGAHRDMELRVFANPTTECRLGEDS